MDRSLFSANVHIIGLKLSFDEIDLWWLLNKRIRFMREGKAPICNEIHFYDREIERNKLEIMRDFGVVVHEYSDFSSHEYMPMYKRILHDIGTYLETNNQFLS